ncbi:hypothetical protein [Xanthocytophaga agilis]|uniref:Uncharacterized protein n=1 Tax=Xanthocytophaga agilis TaxID=3048010 RepID=A0AAE3R6T0_9BACT|nr:hypothetical protein [Xanthocytophaga agilis]MDJ1501727.1 hypothetical protein [Xanthocytophaga agilis]
MCRTCTILFGSILVVFILLLFATLVNIYMLYKNNQRFLNNEAYFNQSGLNFSHPEAFSNYRKKTLLPPTENADSVDFDFLHQTDVIIEEALKK